MPKLARHSFSCPCAITTFQFGTTIKKGRNRYKPRLLVITGIVQKSVMAELISCALAKGA